MYFTTIIILTTLCFSFYKHVKTGSRKEIADIRNGTQPSWQSPGMQSELRLVMGIDEPEGSVSNGESADAFQNSLE